MALVILGAGSLINLLEKPITAKRLHDTIESALSRPGSRSSVRLAF